MIISLVGRNSYTKSGKEEEKVGLPNLFINLSSHINYYQAQEIAKKVSDILMRYINNENDTLLKWATILMSLVEKTRGCRLIFLFKYNK